MAAKVCSENREESKERDQSTKEKSDVESEEVGFDLHRLTVNVTLYRNRASLVIGPLS